jgi:hypothetical protein
MALPVDAAAVLDAMDIPDATSGDHVGPDHGSYIVNFDGPDDPTDPLNWSSRYKWSMVVLISVLSLIV